MKEKTSQEVDAELVERVKNGDNEAFSDLYTKYKGKLNYTLLKIINSPEDAEDLTSETFAKAFERINDYSTDYCFSTWLFNIGKNATSVIKLLRSSTPKPSIILANFNVSS